MALGLIVACVGATALNRYKYGNWKVKPDIGVWLFIGGMFTAKALWIVQHDNDWSRLLDVQRSGTMSTGAVLGAFLVLLVYSKVQRMSFWALCDIAAPFAALAEAFGHFGCLMGGCCFGRITNLPWGITFPPASRAFITHIHWGLIKADAASSLPVHPAQLINVSACLILFVVLLRLELRSHRAGFTVLAFIFAHSCLRFLTQFLRADTDPFLFGLSFPQFFCLIFAVVSVALYVRYFWKPERSPHASAQ